MIDKKVTEHCTGCFACQSACNLDAIAFVYDREGFFRPAVDYNKCVQCGKCVTTCPALHPVNTAAYSNPQVFASWNIDDEIRIASTSGGVFSALAEAILENGGHVVGAYYDEDFRIRHGIIHNVEDIPKLRQSKYAQSWIGDVFKEIKTLLKQKEFVLFCGTPCQSAGLQKYLGRAYENLVCCDFICRGVISPKVYEKFLRDMQPDEDTSLTKVHFKNKDFGWNRFSTKLTFNNGSTYHKDRNEDYYMRGYLKYNLYLRPSCHHCQYKSIPRVSDISLGDFWGIGNYDASLDNEHGTSVILVNSEKGRQLLDMAKSKLVLYQRTLPEVLEGNYCLLNAAAPGKYRAYFFKNIDRYRFSTLIEQIDKLDTKIPFRVKALGLLSSIKRKIFGPCN